MHHPPSNLRTDYRAQLDRTGRRSWVEHFYRKAGVDLEHDLSVLNAAPRIRADAKAVDYMRANYVPSGIPRVPVMSYHTLGDGLTSPAFQLVYAREVASHHLDPNFHAAWVRAAGHCTFSVAEHAAALRALEHRLISGEWAAEPDDLNALATSEQLAGPGRFASYALSGMDSSALGPADR